MPSNLGLISVTYAYKFALLSGLNQACITSLFSVTGFYVAILFYCVFKETISLVKFVGMLFLGSSVVILALSTQKSDDISSTFSINTPTAPLETTPESAETDNVVFYTAMALGLALTAPLFWTIRAYMIRISSSKPFNYNVVQLSNDSMVLSNLPLLSYLLFSKQAQTVAMTKEMLFAGSFVAICFYFGNMF